MEIMKKLINMCACKVIMYCEFYVNINEIMNL